MNRLRSILTGRQNWLFIAILIFALVTRLYRLNIPSTYYFDEVYHAVTAKLILHNDSRAYEWSNPPPEPNTAVDWLHPPLAKLTQAASMAIFGENGFGWRFSAAIFGTATIGLVGIFALELGLSTNVALLAMGLLSLDGLALTTSRIAMNDAHVAFFILLTTWLYARWKKQPSERRALAVAAAAGLAVASKWSGLFVGVIIGADQVLVFWNNRSHWWQRWRSQLFLLGALVLLVPAIYLLSYTQMFAQGHNWAHFEELLHQTWWYQTHLEATHPYQSKPWEWALDWRPVYVYADFTRPGVLQNIYMLGNPWIFWGGLLAVGWSLGDLITLWRQSRLSHQQRRQRDALTLALLAYGLTWLPWTASPRIMFFYHYLPALPFLVILLSQQLIQLWQETKLGRWTVTILVVLTATTFILFLPNWTALPVTEVWGKLYFALPRWR